MISLTSPDGLTVEVDEAIGATLTGLRGPWEGDLLAPGLPVGAALDATSPFLESGLRGWVDCFPSIAPDVLASEHGGKTIADHGELWFRAWEVEEESDTAAALVCFIEDLGVRAHKRIAWDGTALRCRTVITNSSSETVPYIWAAHALFDLWPDDVVTIPGSTPETFRFGQFPGAAPLHEFWPANAEGSRRWRDLPAAAVAKYFLAWPPQGVRFTAHGQGVRLMWADRPPLAQLGLWVNRGAFPVGSDAVSHLGIEPGLGWPDDVSTAVRQGSAAQLRPGETVVLDIICEIEA